MEWSSMKWIIVGETWCVWFICKVYTIHLNHSKSDWQRVLHLVRCTVNESKIKRERELHWKNKIAYYSKSYDRSIIMLNKNRCNFACHSLKMPTMWKMNWFAVREKFLRWRERGGGKGESEREVERERGGEGERKKRSIENPFLTVPYHVNCIRWDIKINMQKIYALEPMQRLKLFCIEHCKMHHIRSLRSVQRKCKKMWRVRTLYSMQAGRYCGTDSCCNGKWEIY